MLKKKLVNFKSVEFPLYCDFQCRFALFSKPEASGACRRELSVWCTYNKKYNNKNSNCLNHKRKVKE